MNPWIYKWILGFQLRFWYFNSDPCVIYGIPVNILGFHCGLRYLGMNSRISVWIQTFQRGFWDSGIDFRISVQILGSQSGFWVSSVNSGI